MSRKLVFILLLSIAAVSGLFSLDFSLRPGGFVFIPAGEGNKASGGNKPSRPKAPLTKGRFLGIV
jgi:hypothetical protein